MNGLYVAISLALIAAVSAEMECYKCSQTLSGITELPTIDCLDGFKDPEVAEPADKYDTIEKVLCNDKQMSCYKSISETYQTGISGRFISSYTITRGCMNSSTALEAHCDEGKAAQGYQSVCYCSEKNCNGSAFLYSSIFTISLGLIAALFR